MIKKIYIRLIGIGIELLEKIVFNRKLANIYRKELKKEIKNKTMVYITDVGANRGQSARFFSRLFKEHKIFCFEANPFLIKKLKRKTKNVNRKIFCVAIGDKNEIAKFNVCVLDAISTFSKPNLDSSYNIFKSKILGTNPKKLYKEINVEMNLLDAFMQNEEIKFMDILKIDVEGFENQVLKGAKSIILILKPKIIQVEVHYNDQYFDYKPQLEKILNSYGYKLQNKIKHAFGDFLDLIFVPI